MLAKQRFVFIFVEFRPALLRRAGGRAGDKDAPQRLLRILDAAGYNIFDDAHAQDDERCRDACKQGDGRVRCYRRETMAGRVCAELRQQRRRGTRVQRRC